MDGKDTDTFQGSESVVFAVFSISVCQFGQLSATRLEGTGSAEHHKTVR